MPPSTEKAMTQLTGEQKQCIREDMEECRQRRQEIAPERLEPKHVLALLDEIEDMRKRLAIHRGVDAFTAEVQEEIETDIITGNYAVDLEKLAQEYDCYTSESLRGFIAGWRASGHK